MILDMNRGLAQNNIRSISNQSGGGKGGGGYSGGGNGGSGNRQGRSSSGLWGASGSASVPMLNCYPIQPHEIPIIPV